MSSLRIGLISDTHGLLRPQALAAMSGCERIIHAGDIGSAEVLRELQRLAPVHAIGGNVDTAAWAAALPERLELELGSCRVHVVHDLKPHGNGLAQVDVVVSGHSHRPLMQQRGDVLYINPGSAGPRRFKLPVSVGYLYIEGGNVRGELRSLD